uniref:Uncharacterized protein n=1 Tax=Arundo donax TaxID=35708 RepID=A0A0A9AR91_ARUDO
MAAGAGVAIYR